MAAGSENETNINEESVKCEEEGQLIHHVEKVLVQPRAGHDLIEARLGSSSPLLLAYCQQ